MKKALFTLLALTLLAGGALAGYYLYREHTLDTFAATRFGTDAAKTVEIPPGSGPRTVASLLAKNGVVSGAEAFYSFVRRVDAGPRLKAGEYEFFGALTPGEVVEKIASGQVKVYRFTVPEGLRTEEVLDVLANFELRLDRKKLEQLCEDPLFLRQAQVPAGRIEGFLFPDTYTFTRGVTEEAVLRKMVARTLEEYRKADLLRRPNNRLTLLETITLASIVEKETGAAEERPRISCVFHNRLRLGMKLQTDPTVLYAMRLLRGRWVNNISHKDLETEHPYNTYTVKGLPPGPIASPGAAAIEAALNPLECADLFFVSRNDGTHVFCPDLKCHNAAVETWQREFFRKPRNSKG